jgi:hypothetical protein
MANDGKFLNLTGGVPTQETAINTSAGAGDANKIVKLDAAGRFDPSMMPVGTDIDVLTVTTSEALSAGDFVNLHSSTGLKVRKADATSAGKEAHGFVLASAASGAAATVYLAGTNTAVTGRTVGARQFLHTTAGAPLETTGPSATGNVSQVIGVATSTTSIKFNPSVPILVA